MKSIISDFFRHPVMGKLGLAMLAIMTVEATFVLALPIDHGGWIVIASHAAKGIVLVTGVVSMRRDSKRRH